MGERKKNHITVLMKDNEEIRGDEDLIKHVTEFYKDLFGPSEVTSVRLDGIECNKLSMEDREFLTREFSLEEIKEVVFGMKHNKAAGPDGLPTEFYQKFWEIIKGDLKDLFDAFHKGNLDVERLNHGIIALIPKVIGADKIQQYRPICLLNVSYKILTKVLAVRLGLVVDRLISKT